MKLDDLLLNGENRVEILPPDPNRAKINSEFYQADERSAFGMLVIQSGGVIAGNVVRLLGSSADPQLRDIKDFNAEYGGSGYIILGDDIFGGIFALNLGVLEECRGNVIYFAPDIMEFEDMEIKPSQLFEFLRNGDLCEFYGQFSAEEYETLRSQNVEFNKTLHFYPPQWSAEFKSGKHDVRAIDVREYYKSLSNG